MSLFGNEKIKILNGNLIEGDSGRFTAFFQEFPEIIAEGENEEDAKANLICAFQEVMEYKRQQMQIESPVYPHKQKAVKHFALSVA